MVDYWDRTAGVHSKDGLKNGSKKLLIYKALAVIVQRETVKEAQQCLTMSFFARQ